MGHEEAIVWYNGILGKCSISIVYQIQSIKSKLNSGTTKFTISDPTNKNLISICMPMHYRLTTLQNNTVTIIQIMCVLRI